MENGIALVSQLTHQASSTLGWFLAFPAVQLGALGRINSWVPLPHLSSVSHVCAPSSWVLTLFPQEVFGKQSSSS